MQSKKYFQTDQIAFDWDRAGLIAGVDEAGRGPLAGPVVAAAVILDARNPIEGLADSKTLTAARREKLFDQICARSLCCSIASASVEEIDRLNILQATMLAMRRAVLGLRLTPIKVLVDGNRLPVLEVLGMLALTMPPGNAVAVVVGLLALAAAFAVAGKLLVRHEQRRALNRS